MEAKEQKNSSKTTTNPLLAQNLRFRRSIFATAAGFANSLVIYLAWVLGYVFIEQQLLISYFIISALGYLAFPYLIYSQHNLKFKDPSLTTIQISWQLIMLTLCMYAAPQLRVLLITNYLLILIFSIFKLHPRHMPYLAAGLVASYFAVIFAQFMFSPISIDWTYEFLISLVFVLAIVVVSFLTMEIAGLRLALKRRNRHLAIMTEKNKRLAITDALTGLANRRQVLRDLSRQKALADRGGYNFSVIFVDLDYFKQVNDNYGHATGDEVLKAVAKLFKNCVRSVDYVGRLGGEEFILVLVQSQYSDAIKMANRIKEKISALHFTSACGKETPFSITGSFGVASFQQGEAVNSLIDRADKAVYAAKTAGRNSVVGEQDLSEEIKHLSSQTSLGFTGFEDPNSAS